MKHSKKCLGYPPDCVGRVTETPNCVGSEGMCLLQTPIDRGNPFKIPPPPSSIFIPKCHQLFSHFHGLITENNYEHIECFVMLQTHSKYIRVEPWSTILYADDPLWDGQNCNGPESTCCTNPNIPWFLKTLNETTTDNIELRVCSDKGLPNEDTPLDIC